MFSGIVSGLGQVERALEPGAAELVVTAPAGWLQPEVGESVAVNGCCLTVAELQGRRLHAQVIPETRRRTNLGQLRPGDLVNLEASLALGQRVGGHLVSGHVDGTGVVVAVEAEENATWVGLSIPSDLARYCVPRGSVALDGCSLTLVGVGEAAGGEAEIRVSLVPHTLAHTVAGRYRLGSVVNVEVDGIARLVERLLGPHRSRQASEVA